MSPSGGGAKHREPHTRAPRKTRWAKDGKKAQITSTEPECSPFLEKIPVELRLMIYDYAFAAEPKNDISAQIRREIRARDLGTNREHAYFEPALLQTCRTIRNEAMKPYCYFLTGKQVELSNQIIAKRAPLRQVDNGMRFAVHGRFRYASRRADDTNDVIVDERHSDEGFLIELRRELRHAKRFDFAALGAFQAWDEELDVSDTILNLRSGKFGYRPPHLDVSRAFLVQRLKEMGHV